MKNNFYAFALQIGNIFLPIIEKVVEFATTIAEYLTNLSPQIQTVIAVITSLVAVLAPLLTGISLVSGTLGTFLKGLLPNIITKTGVLGKVVGSLTSAFKFLTSPIGLVMGLLAALYATNDEVRESFNNVAKALSGVLVSSLKTAWSIVNLLFTVLSGLVDVLKAMWEQFTNSAGGQKFIEIIKQIGDWLAWLLGWLDKVISFVGKLFGNINDALGGVTRLNSELGTTQTYGNAVSGGRQFMPLDSGGYMADGFMATGMTFNNNFTITGVNNIDQATANRLADMMTDRINNNLGRRLG